MATSNSSSRMSRLGVFTSKAGPSRLGPSSPPSRGLDEQEDDDDWYIPYNGPYEEPSNASQGDQRSSWGDLLNGWLSEEEAVKMHGTSGRGGRSSQAASAPEDRTRSRVISGASRQTHSTNGRITHLHSHPQPRMPTTPYINLDQAGGIGESPVPPVRSPPPDPPTSPPQPQLRPTSKRGSLASIFTFGRKSMRLSVSMEHLNPTFKRERSNTDVTPPHPTSSRASSRVRPRAHTTAAQPGVRLSEADEYYNSYYSTLLNTPGDEASRRGDEAGSSLRSHPYAYPFPEVTAPEPHSAPPAVEKGKGRLLNTPKISFNLLDPRGPSKDVPAYLKPSPRSSLLKASVSTPNLRNLPKGKQRWWAAETWCDAIMFPRPRFALRFVDPSGSGRIVSPPPSPIMFSSQTPTMSRRPDPPETRSPKKARSTGNMVAPAQLQVNEQPTEAGPSVAGPSVVVAEASTSRALRPKSFAWDDLALPSPVPSLAKVLEEGRQLEEQRKQWQTQASRSFLDKRAGTVARARSKSIGAGQTRPRTRSKDYEGAFERLAERTLLGNQIRPPTIHVRGPSVSKSHERSQSHSQTQTQTQIGTTQGTVPSTTSQIFSWTSSRARGSHTHSNSLGNSWKSTLNDSSGGHSRSHSVGKSALKLVVSTATNAAAFCGLSSPSSEKGGTLPAVEEKEVDLQNPGPRAAQVQNQTLGNNENDGNVIVISPTSPSAALAMLSRSRENDVSPTPSALSGSAEGVGIAITLSSDDHSRQQGREPIRIPAHPYAQAYRPVTQTGYLNAPGQQELMNRHRQPVLIHPYSQPGHPYASVNHPTSDVNNLPQHVTIPSNSNTIDVHNKLYAELTPGNVREFAAEDIRYSPDMVNPPVVVTSRPSLSAPLAASGHPYGPASKRTSELGFGEALMKTMRRTSVDSGLGTSESGGGYANGIDREPPAIDLSPQNDIEEVARIRHSVRDDDHAGLGERPGVERQASDGVVSYKTTPSTPPEHLNPPTVRRTASGLSASRFSSKSALANSSGSSPGMVSHDSSPPLSPRPINVNEDLERYRDLFYRPTEGRTTVNLEDYGRPIMSSRRPSDSIPVDVSSQSTRSGLTRSGLSDLARQLSEDLEELRRERGSNVSEDSQMWGRRYGGLRGARRPEDMDDPNVVLAQLSSTTGSPGTYHSPLRLPIDTSYVNPETNIPEDIESSRASSILELASVPEDLDELVRMGEVEAVTTPPIMASPQRFSTEPSLVGHGSQLDEPQSESLRPYRVGSQQSTLLTPVTPNTRSSYMTESSHMSGLSDFPAPPSHSHDIPLASSSANNLRVPPRLVREISYGTFGRQTDDEYSVEAL